MVRDCRQVSGYHGQPILFNEDDHFDFDKPTNNMLAAISEYASWGYFDYRMADEGFDEGYQSVPVNWGISFRPETRVLQPAENRDRGVDLPTRSRPRPELPGPPAKPASR